MNENMKTRVGLIKLTILLQYLPYLLVVVGLLKLKQQTFMAKIIKEEEL